MNQIAKNNTINTINMVIKKHVYNNVGRYKSITTNWVEPTTHQVLTREKPKKPLKFLNWFLTPTLKQLHNA